METIAFYSYKGGVGRTLLVANTAQFLAMSGRRVVVLDLDLEAPGLHQKLAGLDIAQRAASGELKGAVDELLDLLGNEPRSHSLRETAVEVALPSGATGSLVLIPAGSAPSYAYWAKLEQLNGILRANRREGGLLEAVLELQARIADEYAPEFLLVDSRTGITEIGGLATSVLADRVVCMTTTAPESVEGTRIVADALRRAPRLSSQGPLRIDFLITRITSGWKHSPSVSQIIKEFGGTEAVLPHDSGIADEERVLSGWRTGLPVEWDEDDDAGEKLFSATLSWISRSFPGHKEDAERAQQRMKAVHYAWEHLTRTSERVGGGIGSRDAWPVEKLRGCVRFTKGKQSRQADIAVYNTVPENANAELLMIIEYVDREDRDAVARWWLENARPRVVVVLSDNLERRLYSRARAWDSRARHSERWDIPMPHDFEALSDPTDVSVDAMLDAVRRGHCQYLDRIVAEWVRCSAAGLHGGAPWKPRIAKKILDGLAQVDDADLARRILWAASPDPHRRGMWLGDGDDYLTEQVHAELFTPLLWRSLPEAAVALMGGRGRPFGPPPGVGAISLLARDILGLRYDPDATFRSQGQRLLDESTRNSDDDDDRGLYGLTSTFKHTEISFEISSCLPPLALGETREDEEVKKAADVGQLMSERIAASSLVITGLLGDYQPHLGRVLLYSTAIEQCADKLALRERHVGGVTLIHETIHALAHLGRDLDRHMWPEFALPAASSRLFEPSWFHETLTQYFTYQHILQLHDPALLNAFEVLSSRQAPAYKAWQRFRDLPIEDARCWFMSVRRGTGPASLHGQTPLNTMWNQG